MCIWDDGGGVTAAAEQNFEKMAPQSSPKFKTTSSISHKFVPRYIRYSSSKRQIFLTHDFYDSLAHKGNYRIDLLLLYQHRTLSTHTLTDRNYYKYIFSFKYYSENPKYFSAKHNLLVQILLFNFSTSYEYILYEDNYLWFNVSHVRMILMLPLKYQLVLAGPKVE